MHTAAYCRNGDCEMGATVEMVDRTAAELAGVPGIEGIDHIAIAVPAGQLEAQVAAYALLGMPEVHREEVRGKDMVREVMLEIGHGPSMIQLLEPMSPESPVQKLIERNGGRGGFAHVAFRVKSAQRAFEAMQAAGFQMIDAAPRAGSRGTTVFFVHPKSRAESGFGYLIEMVEVPE
jgi:methylmalonyl-CoA/ethylmalonyl-CoA epimerase